MIGCLPTALEIGGQDYTINPDFRNVLTIFEAFSDDLLTDREKAYICLKRLYISGIPYKHVEEAIRKAYWFCDGGDMPKTKPDEIRTIDWKHDEQIIFPAVSKTMSIPDVRSLPYLHWWTFLGCFGEIGEGLFSTVLSIRRKKSKGKKLEKYEQEFFKQNKELIVLRTAEEQAAIDETEEFLKTII